MTDALQRYRAGGASERYRFGRRSRWQQTVAVFGVFGLVFDLIVYLAATFDTAMIVIGATWALFGLGSSMLWRVMDWLELDFIGTGVMVSPFEGDRASPSRLVDFADIARIRTVEPRTRIRDFVITLRDGTDIIVGTAASIDGPTATALAARIERELVAGPR